MTYWLIGLLNPCMQIQRDRFTTFLHILNIPKPQDSSIAHRLVSIQMGECGEGLGAQAKQ